MEEFKRLEFNEWWLSLSDGQQDAWREDKWMLANISFRAGQESIIDKYLELQKRCGEIEDFMKQIVSVNPEGKDLWIQTVKIRAAQYLDARVLV